MNILKIIGIAIVSWAIIWAVITLSVYWAMGKKEHDHVWKLKKETSRFATNIRNYKCRGCGKEKNTYCPWGSEEEYPLDKD